ncbi:FBP domain-containing protein [Candidatus Saccharibacteria bacterium]|nr:FBP domain-containing protein [Candidatus Saccharibacteria bacterium]
MIAPSNDELSMSLKKTRIKPRIIRELRYVPSEILHSESRDFLVIMNKSRSEGVLLFESMFYPFSLTKKAASSTGRVDGIICDICSTWQRGNNAARIAFAKGDRRSVSYLVCADLDCSLHVRDMTPESKLSRVQLREHVALDGRIERLYTNLSRLLQ